MAIASSRAASTRAIRATAPIAQRVVLYVVRHPDGRGAVIEPTQLGDYEGLGFSLKGVVKGVAKVATNVAKAVGKGAVDTAHVAGKAATSTVGKTILGGALALTGVGIPAAAGIMAATQAGGNLIKPGGNIGKAARGAAEGAAEGVVAGVAGKGIKKFAPNVTTAARKAFNKVTPGDTFKTDAQDNPINAKRKTTVIPPVRRPGLPAGTPLKFAPVPDLIHGGGGAPPVVKALPEIATEVAAQGKDDKKDDAKKTGGAKRTRIGALVDKAKEAAETVQQGTAQVEQQFGPPPQVYNPGTGPLANETPQPAADAAPAKHDLPLPLILAGAGALVFLAMSRKS